MTLRVLHEMPPRWDGHAVLWKGWSAPPIICTRGVPPDRCEGCGSDKEPSINLGQVADDPA